MAKSKAAALKLKAVGKCLRDAHERHVISDELRDQLLALGLTDLNEDSDWLHVRSSGEPAVGEIATDEPKVQADAATSQEAPEVMDDEIAPEPPAEAFAEPETEEQTPTETEAEEVATPAETTDALEGHSLGEQVSLDASTRSTAHGWGLLWCVDGQGMHVIEYAGKEPPWKQQVDDNCKRDGILMMRCRRCREKRATSVYGDGRYVEYGDRRYADEQTKNGLSFVGPLLLARSEAREVAMALRGKDVQFAQSGNGVAFVNVEELVQRLGPHDTIASVDLQRFRDGVRHGLIVSGLRGGLL